ncbi:MAG: hypothetical protein KDB79_09305 [Acidobacteria bacterium]|nr:hypothetical protein [Acidobacteriota bacterium]
MVISDDQLILSYAQDKLIAQVIRYVDRIETYFSNRLVVKLENSNAALISSVNRTPNFRKWIEGELIGEDYNS